MKTVFVYGTLKRGGSNHQFLAGQKFLGEARTVAGFALYALGDYPGMVRAADDTEGVSGELWSVEAACLAQLDQLEGVDEGLYARVPVKLAPPFSESAAETYLYLRSLSGAPRLGSHFRI